VSLSPEVKAQIAKYPAINKIRHELSRGGDVHFMRNALAHAGKSGRRVVSALLIQWLRFRTIRSALTEF
jgi:hypothetical protein